MKLLDLFCGAGGAAMGYFRAGFTEIVGIDVKPQPRYPFTFIQADALTPPADLTLFDLIHASPPCQGYSQTSFIHHCQSRSYPRLIQPLRELLRGRVYVIENVKGAPLVNPIELCGTAFGLTVRRHRLFESSVSLWPAPPCRHGRADLGVYANKITRLGTHHKSYRAGSGRTHWRPRAATLAEGQTAMGIDWMNRESLSQAIPPAYTEWIGRQIIHALKGR